MTPAKVLGVPPPARRAGCARHGCRTPGGPPTSMWPAGRPLTRKPAPRAVACSSSHATHRRRLRPSATISGECSRCSTRCRGTTSRRSARCGTGWRPPRGARRGRGEVLLPAAAEAREGQPGRRRRRRGRGRGQEPRRDPGRRARDPRQDGRLGGVVDRGPGGPEGQRRPHGRGGARGPARLPAPRGCRPATTSPCSSSSTRRGTPPASPSGTRTPSSTCSGTADRHTRAGPLPAFVPEKGPRASRRGPGWVRGARR